MTPHIGIIDSMPHSRIGVVDIGSAGYYHIGIIGSTPEIIGNTPEIIFGSTPEIIGNTPAEGALQHF